MRPDADFETLAGTPDPLVEELALALAAELRATDRAGALARLDALGEALAAHAGGGDPEAEALACAELLGGRHGLTGDRDDYDHPRNSMLDVVLERGRGLPIALSVVYVAAARRAGIALAGVGLPGHFVVAHFGASPPLVLDPFGGGAAIEVLGEAVRLVRPWSAHETALRMLNNLVPAYARRAQLGDAIAAARMRLALPVPDAERVRLEGELRALESRLN
jgi:regulator of sirC expression with transglutaminase-like and TPR domain